MDEDQITTAAVDETASDALDQVDETTTAAETETTDAAADTTAQADPTTTADATAARIREKFGVEPDEFFARLEAGQQEQAQAQQEEQLEAQVKQRTAGYLQELMGKVKAEDLTQAQGEALYTERWHRVAAEIRAEASETKLATQDGDRQVDAIRAEFPDVPLDALRAAQKAGVKGNALKELAAALNPMGARAKAAEAEERQQLRDRAAAHRPAAGGRRAAEPREFDYSDISKLSVGECLALEYSRNKP